MTARGERGAVLREKRSLKTNPPSGSARRFINVPLLLLPIAGLLTGCSLYLVDLKQTIPPPPLLAPSKPILSELQVIPSTLIGGGVTTVGVRFRYDDPDGDVGPTRAKVRRAVEVIYGNIEFTNPQRDLWAQTDSYGSYGYVSFAIDFYVPDAAYGQIRLSVALFDNAGNLSDPISTILNIR